MRIEYESERVKKILTDFDKLYKIMGFDLEKKLRVTLNRLEESSNFAEYLALGIGNPHPLHNNLKGYYGVSLTANIRLIIKPAGETLSSNSFIVKGVCDYHGEKENWIVP